MRYFALLLLCLPVGVFAASQTVACTQSAVQAAVNSASNGDVITVSAGTCPWSGLTVNTGITLIASGTVTITGTSGNLSVETVSSAPTRISGFTFTGGSTSNVNVTIDGAKTNATYRLDHNTFTSGNESIFVRLTGNGPGMVDHNSFTGDSASEMIHNEAMGPSSTAGWTDSVTPGSAQMVFVEDNTFTYPASGNPAYFYGTSAIQSYYGARNVIRHNTFNMTQVDQHGTCGNIGARWWEIYQNTFVEVANANQSNYMALRDGSGVVWGNTVTNSGNNQGAGSLEVTEDCSSGTYPINYQIGRGINETLSPTYIWGNDSSMAAGSGSSYVVQNRDFYISTSQPASMLRQQVSGDTTSTTYSYTPYTYPFPTDANGLPNPGGGSSPASTSAVTGPLSIGGNAVLNLLLFPLFF